MGDGCMISQPVKIILFQSTLHLSEFADQMNSSFLRLTLNAHNFIDYLKSMIFFHNRKTQFVFLLM